MNREIKFRAWDNQRDAWARNDVRESIGLTFGTTDYFINIAGEKMARWSFMQYTGFKDKNGKEIYEGDIVVAVAEKAYKERSCASAVIYSRTHCGAWEVRSKDDEGFYEHGLPLNWGGWESLEIIGNIYENKELLKKTTNLQLNALDKYLRQDFDNTESTVDAIGALETMWELDRRDLFEECLNDLKSDADADEKALIQLWWKSFSEGDESDHSVDALGEVRITHVYQEKVRV